MVCREVQRVTEHAMVQFRLGIQGTGNYGGTGSTSL